MSTPADSDHDELRERVARALYASYRDGRRAKSTPVRDWYMMHDDERSKYVEWASRVIKDAAPHLASEGAREALRPGGLALADLAAAKEDGESIHMAYKAVREMSAQDLYNASGVLEHRRAALTPKHGENRHE